METSSTSGGAPGEARRGPAQRRRAIGLGLAAAAALAALAFGLGYVTGRTSPPPSGTAPARAPVAWAAAPVGTAAADREPGRRAGAWTPAAAEAPGSPGAEPAQGAARPPDAEEAHQRVTAEANADLERIRPQLVERCWNRLSVDPGVRSATVLLEITFGADGREVARALAGSRHDEEGVAAVAECLRGVGDLPLSVKPPGTSVGVQLALTLP